MPGINDESTTPNRDAALAGLSESGDSPGSTESQGDPAGDGAGDDAAGAAAGDAAGAGDGQGASGADGAQGGEGEGSTPMARMASFLDGLSETPAGGKPAGEGAGTAAADPGAGAAGDAAGAAQAGATDPAAGDAAAAAGAGAATNPEDEEAQALEGVRSERGRERIRKVFQQRKELETDLGQIRDMVRGTGMTPNDFAQTLEFGRLANSQSAADVEVALGMLETQRTALYAKLGREAPGVDLLKDHADLRVAVDGFEITRERAVELAGLRKAEAGRVRATQARAASEREHAQYTATVQEAAKAMDAYLGTRANEVDHQARLNILGAQFKDPAKLQEFVTTYQPAQWVPVLRMMYDNIRVQAPQQQRQQMRPISARPAALGAPAPSANQAPMDRLASRLDAMGI